MLRSHFNICSLLAVVFALFMYSVASAATISNLFNTGVDNFGNALVTAGTLDPHYSVVASPSGAFTPVAIDDTVYPFPPWLANNAFSRWIGPAALFADGPAGFYTYRTTFNLPSSTILSSVSITGLWGTDDPGNDILINGTSTSQTSPGFTSLSPFAITSGFVTGVNTIDFLVQNAGGPTGLRVDQIQGQFKVPEPTGALLLLSGVSLFGLMSRRKGR